MAENKSVKDLEAQWYDILKKQGFIDIEDTKTHRRYLKKWHSFDLISENMQIIRANRAVYQRQIEIFHHHPEFQDICKLMVKHGNCKFTNVQVIEIWESHIEGQTTRAIAKKLGRTKSRIDGIIDGLRQWMKLI
jgi:hypothetical protein